MRRRRRLFALLFIFSAFATPLGFFYLTIVNESRHESSEKPGRFKFHNGRSEERVLKMKMLTKFPGYSCSKFDANVTDSHPECLKKMNWIRSGWKTHKCYADNYVDGSECSFRYYLSEVETYCPPMNLATHNKIEDFAKMNPSIRRLQPILEQVPVYMKTRINRMWSKWKDGAHEVMEKYEQSMSQRKKLNILVLIGFLVNEKALKLAKNSDHGGPLGELLQWSDLLATLSVIGHHVEVATDKETLRSITWKYESRGPCQYLNGARQQLDIIFTDIMGLNILRQRHRMFLNNNRCRIRLLDSFGTHAEFTSKAYFMKNRKSLSGNGSQRNPWGGHGLDLRQHWTFYPHSHDNTFLGFVVDANITKDDPSAALLNQKTSPPIALVYGKLGYMWNDAAKAISVLKRHVEVHATVADVDVKKENANATSVFRGVINHGFLNSEEISQLLDRSRIFFGLGFPLEGPAPLEAIAHGAVFINAKFRQPKSRKNYRFLEEKPTLREWTSQNPYMEMIGEPHVITVDIEDEEELEAAIRKAKSLNPPPMIPFEFQPAGMLVRVAMLLEKQEMCDKVAISKRWPPVSEMKIVTSKNASDSCEMACHRENLLCEPSFFPVINQHSIVVRQFPHCSTTTSESSPLAPFNCTLQATSSLFSCASRPLSPGFIGRICPCRDHLPEQHAICSKCL